MNQKSRREILEQFLLQVKPDIDVRKTLWSLEKILAGANKSEWPLIGVNEVDRNAVAKSYTQATGIKITKVVCIPIDKPFSKANQTTEKECDKESAIFWFKCRTKLGDSLWDGLRANLRNDLKESLEYDLWENLGHNLADNLWLSLLDSLKISLKTGLRNILRDNLYLSLFYYLGFVLAGRPDQAEKLTGLLEWYSQGLLFLGVKKDEPKTLLVMVR